MTPEPLPRGPRLWLFRLAALVLVPAAMLFAVELGLRFAGVGYRAEFLVPVAGRDGLVTTNQRFGWRFFPPRLARAPVPFELTRRKAEGTCRVFVVGGSAARGTPEPAFGLARILETMLETAYPETRFEVRNAAMTAINSHVVLPIVEELARYEPDLFVVYLGNNEMVGPYGAATVFSPFSPRRGLIRASIALKRTRLGQLFDRALGTTAERHSEWRGMEMFSEQRVAAADPRLEKVYEHLEANLAGVVRAARGAGAEVLLSTVAVNLADQPPFASLYENDLSEDEAARFEELLAGLRDLVRRGEHAAVAQRAAQALAIDEGHAELHFLHGRALLALGRAGAAREAFVRARDLDALRFRADSRVSDAIRGVARAEGVALADAERYFREEAGGALPPTGGGEVPQVPLPGYRLFHEHVHLNFEGNYVLARLLFAELHGLLLETLTRQSTAPPAPPALLDVAGRLAFTPYEALDLERQVLDIVSRPPFTGQFRHAENLAFRRRRQLEIRLALDAGIWRNSRRLYERRLTEREDDLAARRRFATLLGRRGEAEQAVEHWRQLVERIPGVASWHEAYARALADAGRVDEAVAELGRIAQDLPEWRSRVLVNLGTVYEQAERFGEAEDAYRRAMDAAPEDPKGLYNLATLTARRGELEAATALFRDLVERHPDFALGHHNLGVTLEKLGEVDAAAASYRREIEARPERASGHDSLAVVLEKQSRTEEAVAGYLRALEREPTYAPAYFNLADLLLGLGRAGDAAASYERGLRLAAGNVQARYNWAMALVQLGRYGRAADELGRVATAYEAAERREEARSTLERALGLARQAELEPLTAELEKRLEDYR